MKNSQKTFQKIIIASIISCLALGSSFAADNTSENYNTNNRLAFNFSFGENILTHIKNLFTYNKGEEVREEVKIDSASFDKSPKVETIKETPSPTQNRSAEPSLKVKTMQVASPALMLVQDAPNKCQEEVDISSRVDKIEDQIKTQINDKNKLVDSLNVLASSSEDQNTKDTIDEKIVKLETEVAVVITKQKELSSLIASSTSYACNKTLTKKDLQNENDIKDTELEVNKKLKEVNTFIKVDLKKILENIN